MSLSCLGTYVHVLRNGLEMVRQEKPDLILLDIELPGMDGLQVARLLKGDPATRDIPVLAVTAYAMKGDAEKALAAGCDDYISKPVRVHDFLSRIKKFVEKNDRDDKPSL